MGAVPFSVGRREKAWVILSNPYGCRIGGGERLVVTGL